MIRNVLKTVGLVRASFAAAIGMFAFSVYAQEPPPGPAAAGTQAGAQGASAEVERVIVTGSNIPTAEEVGPNPVFSLNRDLINKSGSGTTAEQLLQRQPIMNGSNVPVNNNGTGQSGPAGSAALALRGLDPGATLILVDGRRVAPFPGSANSGYGFVDLTAIPITAVQSIEILKDGASTTYGADAVAGVVNFKLYKDYRGAQVTLQYGNTLDKDAGEYKGDILFGVGDDKTSISGDMFYYHHNSMFNHDRGNSAVPPFLSSNAVPWNLQIATTAALHPFDVTGAPQAPAPTPFGPTVENFFLTPPNGATGLTPASDFIPGLTPTKRPRGPFSGVLPGFNFNAFSSSWPEQERWGGYAAVNHKICDDQLQIYGDFYYVEAKTHDELAPTATNDFETTGRLPLFIPPNHPFTSAVVGATGPGGVPIGPPIGSPTPAEVGMLPGAFNPFNPFEQIISGASRARNFDFGNRLIDNENVAERFTLGVKGDKLFNGSWGYDGAFMYSQETQYSLFQGENTVRLEKVLNANDPIFSPTSTSFIGTTVPFNPFADALHTPFPSNAALVEFSRLKSRDIFTSKLATLDLNIYTTDLFDLPAGGIGLAIGGAFSREAYRINPDDQNRLGENLDGTKIAPVKAGRKSWGIYAETLIPIFSPTWNMPFFHALEFTAGVRYDEWFNNNTNATVPKVGVRWQPFDEQLTIRSTWSEGFLEPSMVQLYGPQRFLLAPVGGTICAPVGVFGPCGSATNPVQSIGNPEETVQQPPNINIHPEHDRAWTGGIVYTPKWIPPNYGTLTLTVDLWDVERSGVAMFFSPNTIVGIFNRLNNAGLPAPNIILPAQPTSATPNSVIFTPSGSFDGTVNPYTNGGRTRSNGVDLGAQYQIETQFGTWTMLSRWSYLNEFVINFPGEKPRQVAGSSSSEWFAGSFFGDVTNPQAWLKWRGDTTLDWTWQNVDLNVTLHTLDGYWEQIYAKQFDGFWKRHWVSPTWFTDAQLSYTMVFTPPVEQQPVAGYSKGGKEVITSKEGGKKQVESAAAYTMPCWQTLLNNTTFTIGVTDIFGEDPPHSFSYELSNSIGYPGGLYDNLGRFVYGRLTKKF